MRRQRRTTDDQQQQQQQQQQSLPQHRTIETNYPNDPQSTSTATTSSNRQLWQSPPPNRVAISPYSTTSNPYDYGDDDVDDNISYGSVHSFDSSNANNTKDNRNGNVHDTSNVTYGGTPSKQKRLTKGGKVHTSNNSLVDLDAAADYHINAIANGLSTNKAGYYQSFVMESPPPNKLSHGDGVVVGGSGGGAGKLYHRQTTAAAAASTPSHHLHLQPSSSYDANDPYQYQNNSDHDDESPHHRLMRQRQFLSPIHTKHHAIQQLQDHHKNNTSGSGGILSYWRYKVSALVGLLSKSSSARIRITRWFLGMGLTLYVILSFQSSVRYHTTTMPSTYDYLLQQGGEGSYDAPYWHHNSNMLLSQQRSTRGYSSTPTMYNYYHAADFMTASTTTGMLPKWYQVHVQQSEDATRKREQQKTQRRQRTQPPPHAGSSGENNNEYEDKNDTDSNTNMMMMSWHRISSLDERYSNDDEGPTFQQQQQQEEGENPSLIGKQQPYGDGSGVNKNNDNDDDRFASMDDLCGYSAQNSVLRSPTKYPSRAVLNEDSRVVITGILSPIGLSLALKLKKQCGVRHIAGVDTMFPNTVLSRLLAQERIQLLATNLPKLSKQVYLSYLGLDPKSKKKKSHTRNDSGDGGSSSTFRKRSSLDDEMEWMHNFEPTHVVHLSSYSMDTTYNDAMIDPEWKNVRSPYVSELPVADDASSLSSLSSMHQAQPYLYPLRSGMVSMEQLLSTIASFSERERPQFIYATTSLSATRADNTINHKGDTNDSNNDIINNSREILFRTMKQIDEVLVDAYHSQYDYQLPSIGLRLPNAIYGPWGYPGSIMHDMMEHILQQQDGSNTDATPTIIEAYNTTNHRNNNDQIELLYVDDAVDAIIAALQHRPDEPTTVTVPPETVTSSGSVASFIESILTGINRNDNNTVTATATDNDNYGKNKSNNSGDDQDGDILLDDQSRRRRLTRKGAEINNGGSHLRQKQKQRQQLPLKDGLLKSLAWHLDRQAPYGPAPIETGDELLIRHGMDTCGPFDVDCHKNNDYLPCNSECNIHEKCLPSIFDDTRELMYNVSEGCDVVLYTQSLGYNVDDIELHAEYMDDKDLDDDELLVCNFAFIPRESDLVSLVANKVPNNQLAKFGIEPKPFDRSSKDMRERKLNGLNGRLLYRGWILIWVKDGMRELHPPDLSLLKLSPSKFFHPTVQHGLFVEDNFKVSPNLDDVLFLVDEMQRRKLGDRSLKKVESIKTPNGVIEKQVKYRIPSEPARRAAILFAPLRYPSNTDDPIIEQYREGRRKLTVYDASKFMKHEVGYDLSEKDSPSLRRQREYYERIPSYINKNTELRSNYEPWYRYSMRHWVRSRWVLHDFTLEDSRFLRCDWYQEHVQWGNDLDQLSFANVMAIRELKRRIAHREPDDHVKTFIEEHPELHDLTDSYEWNSMETEENKLHRDPTNWSSQLPEAQLQQQRNKIAAAAATEEELEEEEEASPPLYVRIMSERVMAASRRIWARMRKKQAAAKKSALKKKM